MRISARIHNAEGEQRVTVATGNALQSVAIASKAQGRGSSLNGGELLMLALATCYGTTSTARRRG